jgi:hemerythrin-like domain-containing protein
VKITDRLKVEHGVFLRQLRYLEHLLEYDAPKAALAVAVETISRAEEHHTAIEDRLLYPALTKVLGEDFPPWLELEQEHRHIRQLAGKIRSGEFDGDTVHRFVQALRVHMEREIHQVFPLVEEILPEERLSALSNWDAEHVLESLGEGT